jgi:hypothetical protein
VLGFQSVLAGFYLSILGTAQPASQSRKQEPEP